MCKKKICVAMMIVMIWVLHYGSCLVPGSYRPWQYHFIKRFLDAACWLLGEAIRLEMSELDIFGSDSEGDENEGVSETLERNAEVIDLDDMKAVVASRDLSAGELIFAEIPSAIFPSPDSLIDPSFLLASIEDIVSSPLCVSVCGRLHPRNIEDADNDEREALLAKLQGDTLTAISQKYHVAENELIRIGLVLQHNGFASGLYSELSMVNHSCDPNCIKFTPTASSFWSSEIWTIRSVKKGEELTICYVEPFETSPIRTREFLQMHHRFACHCSLCKTIDYSNSLESMIEVHIIEDALDSLENDIKLFKLSGSNRGDSSDQEETTVSAHEKLEHLTHLRDSTSHLIDKTPSLIESNTDSVMHRACLFLLSRAYKVIIQANLLSFEVNIAQSASTLKLKDEGVNDNDDSSLPFVVDYIGYSHKLSALQLRFLSADHPDIGTTATDIKEGIDYALQLLKLAKGEGPDGNNTIHTFLTTLNSQHGITWLPSSTVLQSSPQLLQILNNKKAEYHSTGKRLKELYQLPRHYPKAVSVLRGPGDIFRGGKE